VADVSCYHIVGNLNSRVNETENYQLHQSYCYTATDLKRRNLRFPFVSVSLEISHPKHNIFKPLSLYL
jgi:hypothetical protein